MIPMRSTPFGMSPVFDADHAQVWKGFQQVGRLDEPVSPQCPVSIHLKTTTDMPKQMSKHSPAPGRYESAYSMISGTTYAEYNPFENNVFELPDVPYDPKPLKNTDEGPLFRAYFSDAHSVLQTTSQIRQLIVSLNPHLRGSHAYLTDRIAYHYATQVYKLEWQRPFLGINAYLESNLFHPFVCTWKSCSGIKAFGSLKELTAHMDAVHKRQEITNSRLLRPPDNQLLVCQFCDLRYADFDFLDAHVATHMAQIGQAFLESTWRDIEADPGASLGIWQTKPAELDSSPEAPMTKSNPPPKERFPYGGLFPWVGIEGSVRKPHPQGIKTPHQGLSSLKTPPPVAEGSRVVDLPRAKTVHRNLISPATPKEPVSASPKLGSPKKEKLPELGLSLRQSPSDTIPAAPAPVSSKRPERQPPPKPLFKQIGMATVEVKVVLSKSATRVATAGGDESDSDESDTSSKGSEARDAENGSGGGSGMGQGWMGAPTSGQQTPWAGPSVPGGQAVGEGGDGERRGRKRRKGGDPAFVMGSRPRFACPYQVFEPNALNCLERGPKNPLGGCEDISRLKYSPSNSILMVGY